MELVNGEVLSSSIGLPLPGPRTDPAIPPPVLFARAFPPRALPLLPEAPKWISRIECEYLAMAIRASWSGGSWLKPILAKAASSCVATNRTVSSSAMACNIAWTCTRSGKGTTKFQPATTVMHVWTSLSQPEVCHHRRCRDTCASPTPTPRFDLPRRRGVVACERPASAGGPSHRSSIA